VLDTLYSTIVAPILSVDISLLRQMGYIVDHNSQWQVLIVRSMSDILTLYMALVLVAWWIRGVWQANPLYKRQALAVFWGVALCFVIYFALNLSLPMRARPETMIFIQPIIRHIPDNSFPSGHAIFAAACAVGSYRCFSSAWIWISVALLGFVMCLARVAAGIHYPSDIIVGLVIGGYVSWYASTYLLSLPSTHKLYALPQRIASWIRL
jgi:undecaprenyl-diphosphatase